MPFAAVGEDWKIVEGKYKVIRFSGNGFVKRARIGRVLPFVVTFVEKQAAAGATGCKRIQHVLLCKCGGVEEKNFHKRAVPFYCGGFVMPNAKESI